MADALTRPRPLKAEICPYLGVEEDHKTCLAYPSHWNICHHANPACAVQRDHQRRSCLSPKHTDCPVFQWEDTGPLPASLRSRRKKRA